MDPVSELVTRVDAYLKKTGLTATDFGIAVANNSALVPRLRAGQTTTKTLKMVWEYLEKIEKKPKRKAA